MRETGLIFSGWLLVSAWTALARCDSGGICTFFARVATSFLIPLAILVLIGGGGGLSGFGLAAGYYIFFMLLPVVLLSYAFSGLRTIVGTPIYAGLNGICTALFAGAFAIYLRS
jgi:hypothetical protein